LLGIVATWVCWQGVGADEAYYKALSGVEKHPGNVLYMSELKMAEPRHMLLLAGAWSAAPLGLVLGSICIGIGVLASRRQQPC
jgi:hypothetical protein